MSVVDVCDYSSQHHRHLFTLKQAVWRASALSIDIGGSIKQQLHYLCEPLLRGSVMGVPGSFSIDDEAGGVIRVGFLQRLDGSQNRDASVIYANARSVAVQYDGQPGE